MNNDEIDFWLELLDEISRKVEIVINDARSDPNLTSITKIGADGTPTHKIDEYAENVAIDIIKSSRKSLILISEEIGTIKIGDDDAKIVVIMDPLDGTSNAMRNIPCYGISIAIAEIKDNVDISKITLGDIEIGFIKNFPTGDVYTAIRGRGAKKNGKSITTSSITRASESTLCTYIYRTSMGRLDKLYTSVRRMRLMGAIAVELCYVADGTYDVFVDVNADRVFDIAAAQLIVKESNGIVTDVNSDNLVSHLDIMAKTSIIASANMKLHEDVIKLL